MTKKDIQRMLRVRIYVDDKCVKVQRDGKEVHSEHFSTRDEAVRYRRYLLNLKYNEIISS